MYVERAEIDEGTLTTAGSAVTEPRRLEGTRVTDVSFAVTSELSREGPHRDLDRPVQVTRISPT